MLGHRDAIATIAVKNVEAVKKFYEGTLGLKPVPAEEKGRPDVPERECQRRRL